MKESEKRFVSYWKATRQKNKWKFAFVHGVIGWGTITAVILFLLMWGLDHSFKTDLDSPTWNNIIKTGLSPYLGGIFYGLAIWGISERRFKRLTNK